MQRVVVALFALVFTTRLVCAADVIEAELQEVSQKELIYRSESCGTYVVTMPDTIIGSREGVAFMIRGSRAPMFVLTAIERVTIEIDESRRIPFMSVELVTGYNFVKLKISQKELDRATCLATSPRTK